jgi:serine/threonine protein kinase
VTLAIDSKSNVVAVKTAKSADSAGPIRLEAAVLETAKHPLVLGLRDPISKTRNGRASIVTAYAGQGSLADHLPLECGDRRRPNRTAKVIVGIALAMRFVHSCGLVHRDLTPQNILLDWDWTVWIADFGRSSASPPS